MLILLALMTLLPFAAPGDSTVTALPHYPAPIDTVMIDAWPVAYHDSAPGDTDRPALVLIHGLGSNLSFWHATLPAFTDTYRVVALDLPGYGLSGKTDVPGTMDFFADTVVDLLDALGLDRVHLAGVSMGGQIAMTLALDHPERVDRLVLASPAGIETFTSEQAGQLRALVTPQAIAATPDAVYQQNLMRNFATWDERHAWLLEQRAVLKALPDFSDYAEANARSVAGMLGGPVADRLGALTRPVLVVYGEGDLLIPNRFLNPGTPADVAARAGELLPHAEVHLLEDAGHLLMLERPDAFNTLVADFLARP